MACIFLMNNLINLMLDLHFSTEQSDILNFFLKISQKSFQNEFLESCWFELRSVLQHLGPLSSQVPEAVTPG